jgi:DNA-binding beta-propeller fold protein YncE
VTHRAHAISDGQLQYGDLLIGRFTNPVGVFQVRDGSLIQTLTRDTGPGFPGSSRGAAYTPSGKVVTTWERPFPNPQFSALHVFDPADGSSVSIATPQVIFPSDVSVTAAGAYVVNDAFGRDLDVYSSNGVHLRSMTAPPLNGVDTPPMGNAVAADGSIWVSVARNPIVVHFSPTGAYLGGFNPGFNPGDIVVDHIDGTLWLPNIDSNTVHQFSPQGLPLESFPTLIEARNQGFLNIAMAPNRDLFVASEEASRIYRYDRQGNSKGFLSVPTGFLTFMNVVMIPEPSAITLSMLGACLIGHCRKFRSRVTGNLIPPTSRPRLVLHPPASRKMR